MLIRGVWPALFDANVMARLVEFIAKRGLPAPEVLTPLSLWLQSSVGLAFIFGLFTRWAGILCALNFAVAFFLNDLSGLVRGPWSSACLVGIGLYLTLTGAGEFGLDRIFEPAPAQVVGRPIG